MGFLYLSSDLNHRRQYDGVLLAADATRDLWSASGASFELVQRQVTSDTTTAEAAAVDLIHREGCMALLGIQNLRLSVFVSRWAEEEGVLYITGGNNPAIREGRRNTFHIGVPSEMTAASIAAYLAKRGAHRVAVLSEVGNKFSADFQRHATSCTLTALAALSIATMSEELSEDGGDDGERLARARDWGADSICVLGGDPARLAPLARTSRNVPGTPSIFWGGRTVICREFADLAGGTIEGGYFLDMFFRDDEAPQEELLLRRAVERAVPREVATGSHSFGWDVTRLVAEACRTGGPKVTDQIAYLEGQLEFVCAGGPLTFDAANHNGRARHDPTTITRVEGGNWVFADTLGRPRDAGRPLA